MKKVTCLLVCLCLACSAVLAQSTRASGKNATPQSRKQLIAANGLLRLEMFEQAKKEFQEFLAKYPDSSQKLQARWGLGICLYRLKNYPQACVEIDKLIKDKKFTQRSQALAVLGHCYLADDKYRLALESLDEYLKITPPENQSPAVALNRAQSLYMLGKYKNALKAFGDFADKYPSASGNEDVYYFGALCARQMGDNDKALEYLTKLVRNYEHTRHMIDALLMKGQIYQEKAQYDQASRYFMTMINLAPPQRLAEAYYSQGMLFYKTGNYSQAVIMFSELLQRCPQSPYCKPAMMQLAHSRYQLGTYEQALKDFQNVVDNDEANASAGAYWKAKTLSAMGEHSKALDIYKQLIASSPEKVADDTLQFDTGLCLMQLKQYPQAGEHFQKASISSTDPKVKIQSLYRLAWCLHQAKNYTASLDVCQELQGTDRGDYAQPIAVLLAENLFILGKYKQADGVYAKLSADNTDDLQLLLRYAQCAYLLGEHGEVVKRIGKWTNDDPTGDAPELCRGFFMLGHSQLKVKDYTSAEKTLKRLVMKSRDVNPQAMYYLAQAHRGAGMDEQADTILARLLELDDKLADTWAVRAAYDFGLQEYRKGNFIKARYALEKVLSSGVKVSTNMSGGACYMLGWIEFKSGDYLRAAEKFAQVRTDTPDYAMVDESLYYQALSAHRLGKYDQAVKLLSEYRKNYPQEKFFSSAGAIKGLCLEKLGKNELALKELSAIENNPESATATVLYKLAWLRRESDDTDGAIKSYRALLEKFPQDKLVNPVRLELAEFMFEGKDYQSAIGLLEPIVDSQSVTPETKKMARYRLGLAYMQNDEPAKAGEMLAGFAKSYRDSPYCAASLYQAGEAWVMTDNNSKAIECYRELVEKYPDNSLASAGMLKYAQTSAVFGKHEDALQACQKYLSKYPQSEYAYLANYGAGSACRQLGKHDNAIAYYKKVADNYSGRKAASAQLEIGRILFVQKQYKLAAVELVKADLVFDEPAIGAVSLYEAGSAFALAGELSAAKELYSRCIEKYNDTESAIRSAKALAELEEE